MRIPLLDFLFRRTPEKAIQQINGCEDLFVRGDTRVTLRSNEKTEIVEAMIDTKKEGVKPILSWKGLNVITLQLLLHKSKFVLRTRKFITL